jgi:hypothetical protein
MRGVELPLHHLTELWPRTFIRQMNELRLKCCSRFSP